jgi:3D (Asp-Asp-Asp) domain-containing protein
MITSDRVAPYLLAAAVCMAVAALVLFALAAAMPGCRNPCDPRPGYEHPQGSGFGIRDSGTGLQGPEPRVPSLEPENTKNPRADGGRSPAADGPRTLTSSASEPALAAEGRRAGPSPGGAATAGPLSTWTVTAFCPCKICCGPAACGITASGTRANHRLVAAPRHIPFGTRLTIPGYGAALVEDRGGAVRGNRLDVLFPTHKEALAWGIKHVEI